MVDYGFIDAPPPAQTQKSNGIPTKETNVNHNNNANIHSRAGNEVFAELANRFLLVQKLYSRVGLVF